MLNLIIIQARMSSTRLPGKVLKPILEKPMLYRQIERVLQAKSVDKIVVATSIEQSDQPIANFCADNNVECFRGNLNDVLDRFYQCAKHYKADNIVRLTADCPLIDPLLISQIIKYHIEHDLDYTSNAFDRTYPDGLDIEIMKYEVLDYMWHNASKPSEREHVTAYIKNNPDQFKTYQYKNSIDFSEIRWTVDLPEDYNLVCKIFEKLYPVSHNFTWCDVLSLYQGELINE